VCIVWEYGKRTASEEGIELDQQSDVWIIALCDLSVRLANVVLVETVWQKLAFEIMKSQGDEIVRSVNQ